MAHSIYVLSNSEVNDRIKALAIDAGSVKLFCEKHSITVQTYYDCRGGRKPWPERILRLVSVGKAKIYYHKEPEP
jgi:hypothetical protein